MSKILIPEIGEQFIVDIPHLRARHENWSTQYPYEAEIVAIDNNPENSDRQYQISNKRTNTIYGVEKKWFDTVETGRTIKLI